MGKFDEVTDEELENERKARIAKAKRRGHRDEVIILRGRHASRYLAGGGSNETSDDDDEDEDEDEDEEDNKKPPAKKPATSTTKKTGSKPFRYFKD